MSQLTEAEELEAALATQDLLRFDEEMNINEYLKGGKTSNRLQHVVTEREIEKRERERIPKKTRESTRWAVNCYRAWARCRNSNSEVVKEKYPFVPTELQSTSPEEVNYWLTRFILEIMKDDGTPYPGNSLYNMSCGLLRHFREDLKRFELNILSKDEPKFQSFRNALDSRMKEMTASGIGVKTNSASPLSKDEEKQLWDSGAIGFHSSKALSYGVFFYNCKIFGFRAMNEHVNLMVDQYEFGKDSLGEFVIFTGRVSKNVQGGLEQRKVNVKSIKHYAQPGNQRCVVRLLKEYLRVIPENGRFYRKPLRSTEAGDTRFGVQPVGLNTLSKYLQSMCTEAKIDANGRRLTNHSGKVTCATQLYESGEFDEQTIMARTGHRSTAVRSYKRPSDELLQRVSNALQAPMSSTESKEDEVESNEVPSKKNCVEKEQKKVQVTVIRGDTTVKLEF